MAQNKRRDDVIDNKETHQRTVGFSIRRLLWDIAAFLILAALAGAGYLLSEKLTNEGLIGLGIGTVFGIVALAIFLRYAYYSPYYDDAMLDRMMNEWFAQEEAPAV